MSIRLPKQGDRWSGYEVTEDYIPGSVVFVVTLDKSTQTGVFPWRDWGGPGGGKDSKLTPEDYELIEALNEIGHRTLESQRDAILYLMDLLLQVGKHIPEETVAFLKLNQGMRAFQDWTASRDATLPGIEQALAERWDRIEKDIDEEDIFDG